MTVCHKTSLQILSWQQWTIDIKWVSSPVSYLRSMSPSSQKQMMFELEPPGQQPIMMTAMACTGSTPKASDRAKAVKGMMPNWQMNPMMMPQGLLMWPHSLLASTVQPMANMTRASITVTDMLITKLRVELKLLGGTMQFAPEQTAAAGSQVERTMAVALRADIVDKAMEEKNGGKFLQDLSFHLTSPVCPLLCDDDDSDRKLTTHCSLCLH